MPWIGIDTAALGKVVGGIELVVAQKIINRAAKLVGAGVGNEAEDSSRGAAIFSRGVGSDDFELAHDLSGRRDGWLALAADDDGKAVQENLVVAAYAAVGFEIVGGSGHNRPALDNHTYAEVGAGHNTWREGRQSV